MQQLCTELASIKLHPLHILHRNRRLGSTKEVDVDNELRLPAVADGNALKTGKGASDNTDVVALTDRSGDEADGSIGIVEHELERRHLRVGDNGHGTAPKLARTTSLVGHKGRYGRACLEYPNALLLRCPNEDNARDDDARNSASVTVGIHPGFLQTGHIGFVTKPLDEAATILLRVLPHCRNVPLTFRHASGIRLTHFCICRFRVACMFISQRFCHSSCKDTTKKAMGKICLEKVRQSSGKRAYKRRKEKCKKQFFPELQAPCPIIIRNKPSQASPNARKMKQDEVQKCIAMECNSTHPQSATGHHR